MRFYDHSLIEQLVPKKPCDVFLARLAVGSETPLHLFSEYFHNQDHRVIVFEMTLDEARALMSELQGALEILDRK